MPKYAHNPSQPELLPEDGCLVFNNHHNIVRQLQQETISSCFVHRGIPVGDFEDMGIGIEGIFDTRFLQSWQRGVLMDTAIV